MILKLLIVFGCIFASEGRRRVVYNIYTGKHGSFFNYTGPVSTNMRQTSDAKITKMETGLKTMNTNLESLRISQSKLNQTLEMVDDDVNKLEKSVGDINDKVSENIVNIEELKNNQNKQVVVAPQKDNSAKINQLETKLKTSENDVKILRAELGEEKLNREKTEIVMARVTKLVENLERGLKYEKAARVKIQRAYQKSTGISIQTGKTLTTTTTTQSAPQPPPFPTTTMPEIAFTAQAIESPPKTYGWLKSLKFNKITVNRGNAFSETDSFFIPPVTGYYFLYINIIGQTISRNSKKLHFQIMEGIQPKLSVFGDERKLSPLSVSNGGVVFLTHSNRVHVMVVNGAKIAEASFSGYLLYPSDE